MKKQQRPHASHPAGYGFFSITNQLRYGLVVLVVMALLLVSGTLTYLSFQAQMQQLAVAQQEISQAAAAKINVYLDDLQRKLSYLARVQGLTDLSPEIQQRFLAALTRHHNAYETVAILDNQGKVVSAVSPYGQVNLEKITQTSWILYAFKYKEDFVSPVEIDSMTKLPMVTLAVPIRNLEDKVNGVLIARINLKFLRFFIHQTHVGKTGYAYVIDHRDLLIAAKSESLEFLRDLSNQPLITELEQLKTKKSLATYRGLKGVEVVGAIAPINSLRWQVVVELPIDEAYTPIHQMLFFMGVSILIATAVSIGLGIWFQRQIVLPLQRLTTAAARISTGDLDTHIKVVQRNEMGVLATTFNQMTLQLQKLIHDLSQERNFVAAILDTVDALVIVVDQQGRIIRFNRACEQITKYSLAEVEYRFFWDVFSLPEKTELAKSEFHNLNIEQFPKTYESHLLTKDEQQRLVAWSTTALVDNAGQISYIIGTGLDITERREAEIALQQSEERFRMMVEGSEQVFFYIHDRQHILEYLSPSVQTVLGYAPEELTGRNCEYFLIDDAAIAQAIELTDHALLTGERNQPYVVVARHKDGHSLFLEIVETPIIMDGNALGMQGFARDITERRQAEMQLRAAIERERLIAAIALRILWSLNLEEILHTTVTEVRQFLQADRVFISNFNDILPDKIFAESISSEWESILDLFLTDSDYIQEIKNLYSQGNLQKIDDISQVKVSTQRAYYFAKYQVKACLAVPIMVGDEFFGTLVVHQCSRVRHWQQVEIDLLQQLATQVAIAMQQAQLFQQIQALNLSLERKVEARTAQLQQKMMELQDLYKQQDEFLHAVSHDLRTPITGTLMLLKHWQQSSVENISISHNILERMIESGERQLQLINSLLETHLSEIKGISLHSEPVKINDLVQSITEDLEALLVKNQATVQNLFSDDLPLVKADPLQLRRVFENLISNALNHNPPGLQITLQASLEGEMIRCLVQDNGVGMSEEQCSEIFERYSRGDRLRGGVVHRARSTGIGLGLYLCRQIITAHGGQIGVQSSLGKGATFWFTLPVSGNMNLSSHHQLG